MRPPVLVLTALSLLVGASAPAGAVTHEEAESLLAENAYRAAADAFAALADASTGPDRGRACRGLYWSRVGRGDPTALLALVEAVVADPAYRGNDWLIGQIALMAGTEGPPEDWPEQLARMEAALSDQPRLTSALTYLRAWHADQRGDWEDLAARVSDLGRICDVLVCGPFDNVAGSGMSVSHPPEEDIDLEAQYPGLRGMPVRWLAPRCNTYGSLDLAGFIDGRSNALAYVLTHLRVDEATDVSLHLSGAGAFRLWLNGALVLSEDEPRDDLFAIYELPTRLEPGWNRLLIKAGAEEPPLGISLRVTDREGRVLHPEVRAEPPVELTASGSTPANVPAGVESFAAGNWRREWASWPLGEALSDQLIVLVELLGLSFLDEAEALLDELEASFPQSETVGRLRVEALRLRESPTADGLARSWAAKAPESLLARLAVVNEVRSRGEEDLAEAETERLREDFPESPMIDVMHAWTVAGQGETARALEIMESTYRRNPRNVFLQDMYTSMLQTFNRQADYRRAVAEALELRPDLPNVALQLASIALERHDVDAAVSYYEHALRANGLPSSIYAQMAAAYETENRLDEAIDACAEGLRWSPYSVTLHDRMARLLLSQERREEAIEHLDAVLAIAPANVSARELLRKLQGRPELSELFERDDPRDLREAPLDWIETPAQACYLVDQVELTVLPGGAQHYRRHYAILIRDEGGVANYRALEENTSGIEIARILKADGQEVEAEIGWGEITFPDLSPGDVIEVRVQADVAPLPGLADHFWHGNAFQYEIPCLRSRFSLLVPRDHRFEERVHNGEIERSRRDVDEWTLHRWDAQRVPALPIETASPPALDQVLWLDVSSLASWDMLVKWFRSESEGRLRVTGPVRDLAMEIAGEAASDSARIHALSTFVRSNVEYEGGQFIDSPTVPRPAEEVLRTRFGDCKDQSGLIIAALRELGITACFALVNSREVTTLDYLPSPRFTHAIVYARTDEGRVFWIDPTDEALGFPNVPSILEGMTALLIDPTLESPFVLIPQDDPADNGMYSRLRVRVTEDDQLEIEGECTYRGEEAALLRVVAEYLPEYMDTGLREVLGGAHPGAIIREVDYTLGETLEDEARLTYSLRAPAHLAKAGSMRVLELPWTMWFVPSDLVPTETRRTPLEVVEWRGVYVEEITLELPAGLRPMDVEPLLHLEEPFGTFELRREESASNMLVCSKSMCITPVRIEREGYAAFRDFVLAALEAEQEQIVLVGSD